MSAVSVKYSVVSVSSECNVTYRVVSVSSECNVKYNAVSVSSETYLILLKSGHALGLLSLINTFPSSLRGKSGKVCLLTLSRCLGRPNALRIDRQTLLNLELFPV